MLEINGYEERVSNLNLDKLMEEARKATGLSDYGDTSFVEPTVKFLDRVAREIEFHAEGLDSFRSVIIRILVNKLRMQEDVKRHPEILEEDVSDPLIIIGLPRSGTTKMQRMIASAPAVQKLYMWRMLNPAPFPEAIPGQPDPRIAAAGLDSLTAGHHKKVHAAHAMAGCEVDEEFLLLDSYDPSVAGFSIYLPLFFYQEWIPGKERGADRQAYRHLRKQLQYLQWQDGGKRGRPWILKAVMHHAHMEALLEYFPKATLLHCHRDPQSAIPSNAKLLWTLWSTKAKNLDKQFVGHEFLNWASTGMQRYLEVRKRLQLDGRIFDAQYEDIRSNVMPIIRKVYDRAGWDLTAEAEQAMLEWERNNEQGKHGKHDYALDELGLNPAMIDHALAEYIERFISR